MNEIYVEVEGLQQVMSRIYRLPDELIHQVLADVTDYSLEVLKEEPKPNYVTRKAAYGVTFFTPKQRRWFFAALADGTINVPYKRTGNMSNAWQVARTDRGVSFYNTSPGSQFVIGDLQSRHEKMVGWKKARDIIEGKLSFKSSKFRDVVMRAYQKAIRMLQLG